MRFDLYRWWIKGSKTTCADCGKEYIQDLDQDFLDVYDMEFHPDIRLLCPKCRTRLSGETANE